MLLTLWAILIGLCLVLIVVGLTKPTESAQALIGFFLLFLLSLTFLNEGLDYKSGENKTYVYGNNFSGYHWDYEDAPNPSTSQDVYLFHVNNIDSYDTYTNHNLGYWLSISSAIGFIGVIFSLAKTKWGRE